MTPGAGLTSRRRLRRLRVVAADKAYPGGLAAHVHPAGAREPEAPATGAVIDNLAERDVPTWATFPFGAVQQELAGLITDDELAELAPLLTAEEREFRSGFDGLDARVWSVALAVHHGVGEVAERTGLSPAMPPPAVHSMTPVTWVTRGDPRYADLVLTAFEEAGLPLLPSMSVLDFGCSSGRVVRMLAARRPELTWHGCDVNAEAIAWARASLPAVQFHDQPMRPPMTELGDAGLDAAFAISIWSHYDAAPALAWLEEMRRIIKPGGALLLTTHGYGAIAERSSDPRHGQAGQEALLEPLYREGFAFVGFGSPDGDGGVIDDEWGTSFLTPEWLAAHLTPDWSIRLYRPRAIEEHQDLYVLRREQ